MMKRIILLLVIMMYYPCMVKGQNSYGILIVTEYQSTPANGGSDIINISTKKFNQSLNFYYRSTNSTDSDDGDTYSINSNSDKYLKYYTISDDFSSIKYNLSGFSSEYYGNCNKEKKHEISKSNFTQENIYFSGCITLTLFYPTHIDEPLKGNNSLCISEIVTLKSGYHWQYNITDPESGSTFNNSWIDFDSSFQRQRQISFTVEEILGRNDFIGNIRFRTGYNGNYPSIATYVVKRSPPQLSDLNGDGNNSDGIIPINTKCSGGNDGGFKIYFDRQLTSDEQLVLFLKREGKDLPNPPSLTKLTPESNGKFSYEWKGLIAKEYTVSYQSQFAGPPTYYSCSSDIIKFEIKDPDPVTFSATPTPVSCHGGANGSIIITAGGGATGSTYQYQIEKGDKPCDTWQDFTSGNKHMINGLLTEEYTIRVRSKNGECNGKHNGNLEQKVSVAQPEEITVDTGEQKDPRAFEFTNGSIPILDVKGGTPNVNNHYTIEWRDDNNNLITTTSTSTVTDSDGTEREQDSLSVGAGRYTFKVLDANYDANRKKTDLSKSILCSNSVPQQDILSPPSNSVPQQGISSLSSSNDNNQGCTHTSKEILVEQPPLLELRIEETHPISCNNANTFGDISNDGELKAIAKGGVPMSARNHYYKYKWKKKNTTTGNWEEIKNLSTRTSYDSTTKEVSHILSNIDTGEYAVNVEDDNGNVIGTADVVNNKWTDTIDVVYDLKQPDLLETKLTSTVISCAEGNDGTAKANITGGVPPYNIRWSNGEATPEIDNLIARKYSTQVYDDRGCKARANVKIKQLSSLDVAILQQTNPTCYQGNDGVISLNVTGGKAPYTYLWTDTGQTTTSLSNLSAGKYTFEVTDANGCKTFAEIVLTDPAPVPVDLGEDRTLCNGQMHHLDVSISDAGASYLWTSDNGFTSTSPSVSLTDAGTYTATVTSGLGCVGTDTIVIGTSSIAIDSQFLLSSQAFAGESVALVNTSNPLSEDVKWILPKQDVDIVEESNKMLMLQFNQSDVYRITLRSFQGKCYQDYTKPVVVGEERETPEQETEETPYLLEFTPYPNPNTGRFTVKVILREEGPITLSLLSFSSSISTNKKTATNASQYDIDFDVSLPTGIYMVLLETIKGSEIRKIIIQ